MVSCISGSGQFDTFGFGERTASGVVEGEAGRGHAAPPQVRRTGGEKPLTLAEKIVVIWCAEVSNRAGRSAHFIGTSCNNDTNHRTGGIAGRTRRCGGGVAAHGERVIGHQGDMFWRAHLKLARQMAGERS